MTYPSWPANLRQRVGKEGYAEGYGEPRLRTPVDAGPVKSRLRSGVVKPIQATLELSVGQKTRLESFIDNDLLYGVLPFWMPDQTHDGRMLSDEDFVILVDENGAPLLDTALWLVSFGSLPTFSALGADYYKASFTLEVMP